MYNGGSGTQEEIAKDILLDHSTFESGKDSTGLYNGTVNGVISTTGKYGDGMYFDGTDDYVDLNWGSNDQLAGYGNMKYAGTICVWHKPNSDYTSQQAIVMRTNGRPGLYLAYFDIFSHSNIPN